MVIVNSVSKQVPPSCAQLSVGTSLCSYGRGDEWSSWKGSVRSFVMCTTIRKNKVVPPDCFSDVKVTYMGSGRKCREFLSLPMKLDKHDIVLQV